jgi:phytoene/squalene synthetase
MSVNKPKQQQKQTHKSPAGQSVVSFDQNLEATTTATTRHALDAQTTENVLSGFSFDSSNNFTPN